jgi:lysophospholipase L1-like esterase
LAIHSPFSKVQLTVGSRKSPEFYGIALDCHTGVAVDNMPFRGSSGAEFTRMNQGLISRQLKFLNGKLIVLQFGVNVVPYIAKDYQFYESMLYSQLAALRRYNPQVSILVVGVSDMSRRINGEFVSYPNVALIRDAQRNAAFKAGCAFWDLYEAMGGENSMPSWVYNKPALANKDFTHFTARGAQLVAEMLYKALMTDYETFNTVQ